jgi:uncharacterized OB-fold protein
MTLLQPQTGPIPVPVPTLTSQPYWEGCARGELLFQRCADCHTAVHTPAVICGRCWSRELSWERSAGTGTVYSWTTVWRPPTPAFEVPYAPVIVDVDEGWQMLSCLLGCGLVEVVVGLRVEVEFHAAGNGVTFPYFRPLRSDQAVPAGG